MFDTDLGREYETTVDRLGLNPRDFFEAGARGAVRDDDTHAWLRDIRATYDWAK